MQWLIYATLPFISALIGWLTNYLAIRMLFRPREPRRILGLRWQGLIPRRHEEIANQAGELVERELLRRDVIPQEIARIDIQPIAERLAQRLVREGLMPKLDKIPLLGNFINENARITMERVATKEMLKSAPQLVDHIAQQAEAHINIRQLVTDRVNEFELTELEDFVYSFARKEFRNIEILGAVVGFIVGIAQLGLLALASQWTH